MKVLYVSAEMVPYAKEGGLADVAGALPIALKQKGVDVRGIIPAYARIDRKKFGLKPVKGADPVKMHYNAQDLEAGLLEAELPGSDVKVYFIENDYFFGRQGVYNDPATKEGYKDNGERFIFFSRAVMELLKQTGWQPDIIHLNDNHTALIAAYLKRLFYGKDEFYKDAKTLLSIHNLGYQGIYPKELLWFALLDSTENYAMSPLEFYGKVNFMKAGIMYADLVNTVSRTYAQEIMLSEEYGFGLEGVLRDRRKDLYGIVNGIDYNVWNPETDDLIPFKFSVKDMSGKKEDKEKLITEQNLEPAGDNVPLIGLISRLADQKGFDIFAECIEEMMKRDLRIVLLGTGQKKYHNIFAKFAKKYPGKIAVNLTFNNELAHQIEAASDMFLMPSRYEPCGLNQLYSMKYGTVPIVRATGGLKDTVVPFDRKTGCGTGFLFYDYDSKELMAVVETALEVYRNKKKWARLVKNCMMQDFSWEKSAESYIDLYNKACQGSD